MADPSIDWWKAATTVVGAAVLAAGRWLLGINARTRRLEDRMGQVDAQLEAGDGEIRSTHDAVLVLQTQMEGVREDVGEIKDGQKDILTELRRGVR